MVIGVTTGTMAIDDTFDDQVPFKGKRIAHLSEKTIIGRCSGTDVVNRLGTIIITPTGLAILCYFIAILYYVKRRHKIKKHR
jgi:hypothetical protein